MRTTDDSRPATMTIAIPIIGADARGHHRLISLPLIPSLLAEPGGRYRLPTTDPAPATEASFRPREADLGSMSPRGRRGGGSKAAAKRLARAARKAQHEQAIRSLWFSIERTIDRHGILPGRRAGGRFAPA